MSTRSSRSGEHSDRSRLKSYRKYVADWEENIGSMLEFYTNRVVEATAAEGLHILSAIT